MKQDVVPIDQAGRIVLPKNVRQELAIKPGDTFKVSIEGVAVTLTPNKESTGFVRKGKALVFSTAGNEILSEETVQEIQDQIYTLNLKHFEAVAPKNFGPKLLVP